MHKLQQQLVHQQVNIEEIFGEGVSLNGLGFQKVEHKFVLDAKSMFRECADFLSIQYTGTESNCSAAAEKNKKGLWQKLNTKIVGVKRFSLNSIHKNENQDVIDIILGKHGNKN